VSLRFSTIPSTSMCLIMVPVWKFQHSRNLASWICNHSETVIWPLTYLIIVGLVTSELLLQQPKQTSYCEVWPSAWQFNPTQHIDTGSCFTGNIWAIHPTVWTNSTVMRKQKWPFITAANARSLISTGMGFSKLRQDGTHTSMCLVIMVRNVGTLVEMSCI
jgi:hypothetical protein